MAIDPSAANVSEKKQRKSVVPVLPLPPSDAKWKRQSVAAEPVVSVPVAAEPAAPLTGEEICARAFAILNAPVVSGNTTSSTKQSKRNARIARKTALTTDESKEPVDSSQANSSELPSADAKVELQSHVPTPTSTANKAELPSLVEAVEISEAPTDIEKAPHKISQSSLDQGYVTSTVSVTQDLQETEEDLSRVETVINTNTRQVRIEEEDTPNSEPEISSIHRSSNAGLTDYDPTPIDSSLEAVSDEPAVTRPVRSTSHRKSEAAPEVLTNGHTAHQSIASLSSRPVLNYIPSEIPVSIPPLQVHMLKLSFSRQSSDIIIQLNPIDQSLQHTFHYTHSCLLIRSPRISRAMVEQATSSIQPRMITVSPVRSIHAHAFESALRYFYTDEVLTENTLVPQGSFSLKEQQAMNFNYAMSYWFAGLELELEAVKTRAFSFIRSLVDWEIVEIIMREVQDLRNAANAATGLLNNTDSFEIRHVASTLFEAVLDMFKDRINIYKFKVDTNVQVTTMVPRFAQLDPHRMLSNPALSTMVFGSLPALMTTPTSMESQISAILLNMEYKDLKATSLFLRAEFGEDAQNRILAQVVKEREAKRESVISNRSIPNTERLNNSASWEVAGWKEYIKNGELSRDRVGFLLPNRSNRQAQDT